MIEHTFDDGPPPPCGCPGARERSPAAVAERAADLAERLLDEVCSARRSWRTVRELAGRLEALAVEQEEAMNARLQGGRSAPHRRAIR
ncbi:MAG: hypothetical protein KGJ43_00345 [Acidobacteriota bacterium]|nr:hypothetical protein [Acidobacteriota bacterium]